MNILLPGPFIKRYYRDMRRRPWTLVLLAFFHFLAPLGNIVFNALISGRNVTDYFIMAMSPEYITRNWVILVAPLCAGFAIYACKKWSFFAYLISITALFFFSYAGYMSKSDSISLFPVILVYLINVTVVSYFLIPAVRNIYFDRRMRWWEIQTRYNCNFKCHWQGLKAEKIHSGTVGNMSLNGLFLKAAEVPPNYRTVKIMIPFDGGQTVEFTGEAIVHDKSDAIGFGVKFEHNKQSKTLAKQIVADLEAKGMRVQGPNERPEDSFLGWVRILLTTGKGLFPGNDK